MSSGLRVIFFGTPIFASSILESLVASGESIVAVVTTPDREKGRGLTLQQSAVSQSASILGIPILKPESHKDPLFLEQLRALSAEVFCVVAYKILPREVFAMPPKGAFNIHASLLPKYRGAAPINWAIINGERETGITTFLLQEKVDTGNMLVQERISIGPDETAGELHDRLMHLAISVSQQTLFGIAAGTLLPLPQPSEAVTQAPKIFPPMCRIDFSQPATRVHNFIRGLSPYPAAFTLLGGEKLKLLRTRIADGPELASGAFALDETGKRLFVGTASDALEVLELQREGKRSMAAEEFLRGNSSLFTR
jgi:methionyl-tRNA formyltransferase